MKQENLKVVMVTPRINENDPILGFIPSWMNGIAKRVSDLNVLTPIFSKPTYMENNVNAFTLQNQSNLVSKLIRFWRILVPLLIRCDVLFCHMHPSLAIFAVPIARLLCVPAVLWYAHGSVSITLKLLNKLATKICTSSAEGYRLASVKREIIGQGIDTEAFRPLTTGNGGSGKTIIIVGRVSPVKHCETFIEAANILVNDRLHNEVNFLIIGPTPNIEYLNRLKGMISLFGLKNHVKFLGGISHQRLLSYYQDCGVLVNPSNTGSLDKVVLEAMACEVPVVNSNVAYYNLFDEEMKTKCFFPKGDYIEAANKIEVFLLNDEDKLRKRLRDLVVKKNGLDSLCNNLVATFREVVQSKHNIES